MGSVLSRVGNIPPPGAQSRSVKNSKRWVHGQPSPTRQSQSPSVKKLENKCPLSTLTHQTVAVPSVNPHSPDSADCHQTVEFFVERLSATRFGAIRDSTNPGCGGAGGDIKRLACDSARRRCWRVRGEMGGVGGAGW